MSIKKTAVPVFDVPGGIESLVLSPDDHWLAIAGTAGGGATTAIYLIDTESLAVHRTLDRRGVTYTFGRWLPSSQGFVFSANLEDARYFGVYEYDLAREEARQLCRIEQDGYWDIVDIASDESRVLLGRRRSTANTAIYECDLTGPAHRRIPGASNQRRAPVGYLESGEILALAEDDDGLLRLRILDRGSGEPRCPWRRDPDAEVEFGRVSPDRKTLLLRLNDNGAGPLRLYSLPSFEEIPVPGQGRGISYWPDLSDGRLVWTQEAPDSPSTTYAWDIGSDEPPRVVLAAELHGLNPERLVAPQLVWYRASDGLRIPALLYVPPARVDGKPMPFVVHFHGGPTDQHRPYFYAFGQYLLSRGIGLMQPNVRGSSGYGRRFQQLDDGRRRPDAVRDGVDAARWLIATGHSDKGLLGAYGGSYGGFMAVACAIEGKEMFRAVVSVAGIYDFNSYLQRTSDYRRRHREAEYGSLENREFLASISPLRHVDQLDAAVFLAHGLNDPRVPVAESMQLAIALQRRGRDPELLFLPDEGHVFQKPENRELLATRAAHFFERHLLGR